MKIYLSTVARSYPSTKIDAASSSKQESIPAVSGATAESTKVSISPEGLRESTRVQDTAADSMSLYMHSNPNKASVADFVETMATVPDGALVSVGATPGDPVRYSNTGEMVTSSSIDRFNKRAQEVLIGRQSIYREEVAKGTDPADIYDKMVSYMKALPADSFKSQVSGWGTLGTEGAQPAA